MDNNQKVATEYESKFRFYFVALNFTLLAATIQTAQLSEMSALNALLELVSWVLLLSSGLAGLSYLEYTPVIYHHFAKIKETEGNVQAALQEQLSGIKRGTSFKYAAAKYGFLIGILLLVVSRGMHGLAI